MADITGVKETEIATASGAFFDYADPNSWNGDIDDIAHGLSNVCRFNGQCAKFYSVAMHSIFVAHLVHHKVGYNRNLVLAALMHDAHEAFYGDIPTPLKGLVGDKYKALCNSFDEVLAEHFMFDPALFLHRDVKEADLDALRWEGYNLFPAGTWPNFDGIPFRLRMVWDHLTLMGPKTVVEEFMYMYFLVNSWEGA